jgi:arylsulfatase
MCTPFQWGKQVASHFGGTRNPLVVSWPARIKDKGGVRDQFHHIIDVVPTILEAAGIREPASVNGVTQKPIEGVSMLYSFADPKARSPRKTQYFEMFGNRAIYDDGWIATCRHGRLPWENLGSVDFDKDTWELYKLDGDFSEANDLASQHPQKLRDLQDLFWVEAAKYNVLPLDDRFIERVDPSVRPSLIAGRTRFAYYPGARRIPESSSPNIKNKSHTIEADVEIPQGGADGVLVAAGGVVGGYALFIKDGRPSYEYNRFTQERFRVTSPDLLAAGKHGIRVEFKYDGGGLGKGGTVTLLVDGKKVAEGRVERTEAGRFSADETFDTGLDTGSPVSDAYRSPFRFAGTLKAVRIDLAPENLSKADLEELRRLDAARRVAE